MVYLKFVMLWATVVLADYMLEFRFEFLWPFWMMLRSVYDSFKYQGLVSIFFQLNNVINVKVWKFITQSRKTG